jgi:protein-S-isoprenylcysteine O-methyltransferase Ste14
MTLRASLIKLFHNMATGSRKIRNFYTPFGALFFILFVFLFVFLALKVDMLLGISDVFSSPLSLVFALVFFLAAFVLIGWSVLTFFRARGTPVPFNPPPRLVKTGPYSFVRNPMLTGVFALLFGVGFLLGSLSLIVVFTPLFILVNFWELKAIEEPELMKRLGQDYIEYRENTPMFFPKFVKMFKSKK